MLYAKMMEEKNFLPVFKNSETTYEENLEGLTIDDLLKKKSELVEEMNEQIRKIQDKYREKI